MSKVALIVLDGLGIRKSEYFNAVKNAKMPYFNSLLKNYSHCYIKTCGEYVGLEKGQFGNSEVGHLNLGAGRIVKQNSTKITEKIENGEFFNDKELINLIDNLKKTGGNLHLFGLCSSGGVHSKLSHLISMLKVCKEQNFKNVLIHFISDGRDTGVFDGKKFLNKIKKEIKNLGVGKIISLSGRFYAMDREKNYDRTKEFLNVILNYKSENVFNNFENAFKYYYENNITDEFIKPTILKNKDYKFTKKDAIICFNFRSDRVRQIYELLIENNIKNLYSFISYDDDFKDKVKVIFKEENNQNCLSKVLSENYKTQLRISETTKYAHVTYFFNGLIEKPFKNEKRIIIESEKVENFSKTPKMKAKEITETVINEIKENDFDFILVNYSNADMLGHTGNYKKTIESLEFLDKCLEKICKNLRQKDYVVLITSDHGNADIMKNNDGSICTTHTKSNAPFIIVDNKKYKLTKNGKLANVSSTVLDLLKLKQPKEFTENSLIIKN
ncbi:MAG: 2,3-bisphosphoglycerate-independent phosphoglycerate mutase [Clostridiales bacterium]|nr:2,3-bisphosphoglycerate-independent phosphoglycerate mutase [Clostridiales bacterium]